MAKVARITWKRPCLRVGTISTVQGLKALSQPPQDADILEVRVDILRAAGVEEDTIIKALEGRHCPVLLTLRTAIEGGSYPWKSTERILLFERLLPYCDAIDLELHNLRYVKPVLQLARRKRKSVVLSAHSLQRKITYGKAERILQSFRKYRVQVYKLATLVRTTEDLKVLARLLLNYPKLRLALMGVGALSKASRQSLTPLGSRLIYGYVDEPVTKGQPALKEISELV